MALDLSKEDKVQGKENFARTAEGLTRRGFMKSMVLGGGAVTVAGTAAYFGYQSIKDKPVQAALIGAGDEGGVLVGEHNPEFLEFKAVCDIRPYNMARIFEGQGATHIRKGFNRKYGKETAKDIKKFTDYPSWKKMLEEDKNIEMVVIALPLHLHAQAAIDAMNIGKDRGKPIHVFCEKLMAWNIAQCKKMIEVAKETNSLLAIGHQRHYSLLYSHATEVINSGVLGDIRHIRALWHRNNTWKDPKPGSYLKQQQRTYRDGWYPYIREIDIKGMAEEAQKRGLGGSSDLERVNNLCKAHGYDDIEQLVRWRLYNSTGGGLMAELGSHQLDACSIFLGKVRPIAVTGYGNKSFYGPGRNDRECDDHVFCTYEFPGPNYKDDPNNVVVVTYSSINTNGFESYGECVMGTRGTMVVQGEKEVMLYPESNPYGQKGNPRELSVKVDPGGKDGPALSSSASDSATAAAVGTAIGPGAADVSRGYTEELEHFAYCVRMRDEGTSSDQPQPRCPGEVALADAVLALTANQAMETHQRIEFKDEWFDWEKQEVPDGNTKPKAEIS